MAEEGSIGSLITQLVDNAKTFVRAEIDVYRAQVVRAVADYRAAAILGVVALILLHAAVIALLVGIILSIAQALGPIWATVITIGGTLLLVALLGWLAMAMVRAAAIRNKAR